MLLLREPLKPTLGSHLSTTPGFHPSKPTLGFHPSLPTKPEPSNQEEVQATLDREHG